MTNQTKTIIGIVIVVSILIVGFIGIMKIMDNDYNNPEISNKQEFKITFQHNSQLEKEYATNLHGERIIIETSKITPEIDTSKLGQTKHTLDIDGTEMVLNVVIDDLRKIKLNGDSKIEVLVETSIEELDNMLLDNIAIEGVENEDDITIEIIHPEDFTLEQKGKRGQVIIIAKYNDNPTNRSDLKVTVITTDGKENDVAEKVEESTTPEIIEKPVPEQSIERPKREEPREERPSRPERPIRPSKPEHKPTLEAKFPLKYPELLPEEAILVQSKVKPGIEEFHEYIYNKDLSDNSYIKTAHITFNENVPYSVRLIGQDIKGEILSFNYILKTKEIEYDWQESNIIDENILKNIAKQFAAAFDF